MWGSASFTYDPLDNLRSFNQGSRQYRYVYSPSTWRLDRINRSSGSLVWSFSHDTRGNQTRRGSQDRVFDRANRITQINNENYEYDGHGRRSVAFRSDGTAKVEAYTLDGKLGYITDNRLGGGTSPIYLAGTKVGEDFWNWTSGVRTRTYHHGDMLGSSVAETNTSRMVVQRTEFAAYGEPLNRTVDGQGYTGHVHDDATGLVYAQQRYYDPVVGRFLSVDPVTANSVTGGNFNRYWYANNNPYRFTDPTGMLPPEGTVSGELASGHSLEQAQGIADAFAPASEMAAAGMAAGALIAVPDPSDVLLGTQAAKMLFSGKRAGKLSEKAKDAGSESDNVIHVTKDGVALPSDPKYKIPDDYVQNPHRPSSFGEVVDGKFKERLRIDPATPPGQKGPNYSHYHKDGKSRHYSPRKGDKDPGY